MRKAAVAVAACVLAAAAGCGEAAASARDVAAALTVERSAAAAGAGAMLHAYAPADSSALNALGRKLDEYIGAILPLPVSEQEEECDFLISSCRDSLTRQYVALRLWRCMCSTDGSPRAK